jgi:hypothetical protein
MAAIGCLRDYRHLIDVRRLLVTIDQPAGLKVPARRFRIPAPSRAREHVRAVHVVDRQFIPHT